MRLRVWAWLAVAGVILGGCGGFWDSYEFHPNASSSAPDPGRP